MKSRNRGVHEMCVSYPGPDKGKDTRWMREVLWRSTPSAGHTSNIFSFQVGTTIHYSTGHKWNGGRKFESPVLDTFCEHVICGEHSPWGPFTYYVTLIFAFLAPTHPLPHFFTNSKLPTHSPPMYDITLWISIGYYSAFLIMRLLHHFWHQHRIARLFLEVKPNLFLKRARLSIMKQFELNIELFTQCDITLQKQLTHPVLHFVTKIKRPAFRLCGEFSQ